MKKGKIDFSDIYPHGGQKTVVTVTLESPDKRRPLYDQSPSRQHANNSKYKYTGHGTIIHIWSYQMAPFALKGTWKHRAPR